jgi:hypothetical protein
LGEKQPAAVAELELSLSERDVVMITGRKQAEDTEWTGRLRSNWIGQAARRPLDVLAGLAARPCLALQLH